MEKFHGGVQSEADLQKRWDALKLGNLKGKRVLDVGAAEGWFSKKCVKAGASVYAIEPVRELHGRMGSVLEVTKARFDGASVALPSCVFGSGMDIVLMLRVLYHMKIPQLAIQRAAQALKPGGVLYLENWFDDPQDVDSAYMKMYEDKPDGWRFVPSVACVAQLLKQYGFVNTRVLHRYQDWHRQIWRATKNLE